jgi:hypothetical protein
LTKRYADSSLCCVTYFCLQVYSTPLVGVWVKGPSSVLHPLVTAACLRFAYSSLLLDRAVSTDDGAFLLLLCPEGEAVVVVC